MNFGTVIFRSNLLGATLAGLFMMGGIAQPAKAAPRYATHRDIRSGARGGWNTERRELRRDVHMRNRLRRRTARNLRQLRRSNRDLGRNSLRSRMLRRRLRHDFHERREMNRDIRRNRQKVWRDQQAI